MSFTVLLRGGGDLASGVALRLYRIGLKVVVSELQQPLAVRRLVSFGQAVYSQNICIEGVNASLVQNAQEVERVLSDNNIPVLIDPPAEIRHVLAPQVIIDARMTKKTPDLDCRAAPLMIGLGPGFVAGENCHAVIETKRGPTLGRVIWNGSAESDTGLPEAVSNHQSDRVLRAPAAGVLANHVDIGAQVRAGQIIADVNGKPIIAAFDGFLRGLLQDGLPVYEGMKIGDLDPRMDARLCTLVSDKALAIGGGVVEAIFSFAPLRPAIKEAF